MLNVILCISDFSNCSLNKKINANYLFSKFRVICNQTQTSNIGCFTTPMLCVSLMSFLTVGVEFGIVGSNGQPVFLKHAGCGKSGKVSIA